MIVTPIEREVPMRSAFVTNPKPPATKLQRMKILEIHDQIAAEAIKQIVQPTMAAGGSVGDVLVLLESVVSGVLVVTIKLGGDEKVLDLLFQRVRLKMAQLRLGGISTAGEA
ncbi:hypothetical protein GCM10011611_66620 [Aliidongia dinghuensis]|uniref:Uncharacterized protein n=1 Tax=Aliidongia dinghuensis TaxID=1867774 RepID=A0A8J3E747_9PROT|nr:hypothetical protein [Aliidongia dinghuensis]GGF50875.1 hypothetical protein GCM10011611_66620 [Aliidongia dinghuensis]